MNLNNRNNSNIQFVKAVQDKLSKYSKTLSIFGLTTSKNVQIKESPDSGLYVTPCIYVPSGATGLVYLDYNTKPQNNSVKQFFDIIPAGATLSIQNADYNYNEASLSGFTCTFVEIFNNIAVFNGITAPHLNSSILKYYPEKFDSNLKIVLQSTISDPLATDLLNIENYFPNGDNSFVTNGLVVGDVLEYNEFKFKVTKIAINPINSHEIITVDVTDIPDGSFSFSLTDKILLNVYK